jgi:hypothetical protein
MEEKDDSKGARIAAPDPTPGLLPAIPDAELPVPDGGRRIVLFRSVRCLDLTIGIRSPASLLM